MQAHRRQWQSLRNDRNLARFRIEGRATGKQLGSGSYGSVEEVEVRGLLCAGKKIHEILVDANNVGVVDIIRKFMEECQLMSDLRHPNITQFLGLCFLPDCQLPVLVMEKLEGSLDDLLETVPKIPLVLKRSVFEDVAKGLLFLHSHEPQIIHRDLSAKNVLLTTSFTAKITDLGNSRIVNIQPGELAQTMSRIPGTQVYMPPEATTVLSRYGPSLDVFSFGHLALFTLTQVFPGNLLESTYTDPNNPDVVLGRSEIERRRQYINQMERNLLDGEGRPTAGELLACLQSVTADIEGAYGELEKLDAVRQVAMVKKLAGQEAERSSQMREKNNEIRQLQHQLEHSQAEITRLENELQAKDTQLQLKDSELQNMQERRLYRETVEFKVPTTFEWTSASELPFGMYDYPQAVIVNGKLFMGGRVAFSDHNCHIIMVYDPQNDEWTTLPLYPRYFFTMAAVNNQLVLAGGANGSNDTATAALGAWSEHLKQWTYPFPPMPTARVSPSAVSHSKWLVVIGGRLERLDIKLSNVEILNTTSGQWYIGAATPHPCSSISAVTIGQMCYLLGGYTTNHVPSKKVYRLSLDDLISQATPSGTQLSTVTVSPWQSLPDSPLKYSAAVAIGGSLLAVGGGRKDIYLYQIGSRSWGKVGELATERSSFTCTLLPDGRLLVAGGVVDSSELFPKSVEIATLRCH